MIPGIQASATGIVAAVASRDRDKARETAEQFNIPKWYASYDALLADTSVDAIYIALPNHLHREWTVRSAKAGKHVLCEKPAGLDAGQALHMVTACEQAGVQFAEAFMYRHHPRYQKIRLMIESGAIGAVRGIHATFTFNNAGDRQNIRHQTRLGGGSLYDVGCYPISAARLLLGSEPEAATVCALWSPEHDGVDMMASGLLEFAHQVALTFDCGMWAAGRNTLEVLGTDGRIEVPNAFIGNADFWVWSRDGKRKEEFPELNSYSLQADNFGRSVLYGEPLRYEPADAVRNMEALDACLTAARAAERVVVEHRALPKKEG